jgi:hypothetical protein
LPHILKARKRGKAPYEHEQGEGEGENDTTAPKWCDVSGKPHATHGSYAEASIVAANTTLILHMMRKRTADNEVAYNENNFYPEFKLKAFLPVST